MTKEDLMKMIPDGAEIYIRSNAPFCSDEAWACNHVFVAEESEGSIAYLKMGSPSRNLPSDAKEVLEAEK